MPKVVRPKKSGSSAGEQYTQHGWAIVHSSATSSFFTSTVPAQIKSSMIEANKQKRVLSTGTVIITLPSKANGNSRVASKSSKVR